MIPVELSADEATRTPDRPCRWTALAMVNDRIFEASARTGAVYELARQLVAAGIPDDQLGMRQVASALPGTITYSSFHKMAGQNLVETASGGLRIARWSDLAERLSRLPQRAEHNAQNRGSEGIAATTVPLL